MTSHKRFCLSSRSPSYHTTELSLPLYIKFISWDFDCFQVDDVGFRPIFSAKTPNSPFTVEILRSGISGIVFDERETNTTANDGRMNFAMEYIIDKLLGDRCVPITVETLQISVDRVHYIFSKNLNMICKNLDVSIIETGVTLDTILHTSSYPLKSLSLSNTWAFAHPIILTAELLIVPTSDHFHRITNARVHAISLSGDFKLFIYEWLENGREIGTEFTIGGFRGRDYAKKMVCDIKEEFDERFQVVRRSHFPLSIAIKMNDFSEIYVFYDDIMERSKVYFKVQPTQF